MTTSVFSFHSIYRGFLIFLFFHCFCNFFFFVCVLIIMIPQSGQAALQRLRSMFFYSIFTFFDDKFIRLKKCSMTSIKSHGKLTNLVERILIFCFVLFCTTPNTGAHTVRSTQRFDHVKCKRKTKYKKSRTNLGIRNRPKKNEKKKLKTKRTKNEPERKLQSNV